MPRKAATQTSIPGFGCIFRPNYKTKSGETKYSAVYWMEYKTDDKPVRKSTGQKDQAAAFAELMKMGGARASGEIRDSAPERVKIGQLLDMLLESYEDKQTLSDLRYRVDLRLRPRWGDVKAKDLTTADLKNWVKELRKQELRPATINRYLMNLRRAFAIGLEENLVLRIPKFPLQDESGNERAGIIAPELYRMIRDDLTAHVRLAFVVGYHVGLRLGAILDLRWEWVDLQARVIRIPSKNTATKKQPPAVPIYGEMAAYLEMASSAERGDCPFVISYRGSRVSDIKTAWNASMQRLQLTGVHFHDLRRTAATNMDNCGVSRTKIKQICGWKTDAMFDRYQIGSDQQAVAVGEKMAAYLQQQNAALSTAKPDQKKGLVQ